eukprot:XP_011447942.1 PREDICTED: uncharacterized protein LOC105342656 [Crassostrea gigas]
MLEEVRKSQKISGDVLLKEFERDTSFKGLYKTTIPVFTVKCLELCWLMNMHNPPVALGLPLAKDSKFDGTFYKEYTRTGTTVDFVVWLPLLLHKNGPLLQKGVLQPNPSFSRSLRQKPLSAPANLSKSRRNKEQSDTSGPQADRLCAGGRTPQEPSVHGTYQERGTDKYSYENPYQQTVAGYQQNTASSSPNSQLAEQRTQFPPDAGTRHGTYNYLYGDTNPSTASSYQQNVAVPSSDDYNKDRQDKNSATRKSGSASKTSKKSIYNFDMPYEIEYEGRLYVRFQDKVYTKSQWEEIERKFYSGSSEA